MLGEHDPTGVRGFNGPNQGNRIGNGFLGFLRFRHIVGVGDGAFLAVGDNGDLLWFRYTGNGEQDPSGTHGFAENNSGNQVTTPRVPVGTACFFDGRLLAKVCALAVQSRTGVGGPGCRVRGCGMNTRRRGCRHADRRY